MDVGDAAVGDPGLGAVEDPLVGGFVVDGAGAQGADVGAGVGLGHAKAAELELLGGAEALRDPLADLLGGAVADDAGQAEGGAEDGQPDAGVAPGQLLVDDREDHAGRVDEAWVMKSKEYRPMLGRLLDDRPRGLFPLVPFVGGRPDHVLGEVVDPFLDLELVLVEVEREVGHVFPLVQAPIRASVPAGTVAGDTTDRARLGSRRPPPIRCYSTVTYSRPIRQPFAAKLSLLSL